MAEDPSPPRGRLRLLMIRVGIVVAVILAVLMGINQAMLPPNREAPAAARP